MAKRHRVAIIGGGFGGLYAAQRLRRADVDVTLIDRRNFHLFQPLLYQVATGGLSPANITAPLRGVLRRQRNTRVMLGEATGFDVERRRVLLRDGEVAYDTLIVATGVVNNYFGNDAWSAHAPGLKTVEDATEIRRRVLGAFEAAERATDSDSVHALLTFAIIGAGPTGVELAGAIAEIARHTLRHDFRRINPEDAQILLLDAADRVLPGYPEDLSQRATESLARLGVRVYTGVWVSEITDDSVYVRHGDVEERIPAHTTLWAAGTAASSLGAALAAATGAETDRMGRLRVGADLTLPGHPEILVIGDLAHVRDEHGAPLTGVAPVAIQQGKYAARLISDRMRGRLTPAFRYVDRGTMATIGRSHAVADLGWIRFSGWLAWVAWLFIHLLYLVEFQNRLLVLVQWAWYYVTWNRAARLITDAPQSEEREGADKAAARETEEAGAYQ